jgi:hypothetical protein
MNEANCFYYYQATSGENIFLLPLCQKMIENDHREEESKHIEYSSLPLRISGKVVDK